MISKIDCAHHIVLKLLCHNIVDTVSKTTCFVCECLISKNTVKYAERHTSCRSDDGNQDMLFDRENPRIHGPLVPTKVEDSSWENMSHSQAHGV